METEPYFTQPTVKLLVDGGKRELHVHPGVLIKASPVWSKRLLGAWSADQRPIDFSEFDFSTVLCAVHYLYSGKYDLEDTIKTTQEESNTTQGESNTTHDDSDIVLDDSDTVYDESNFPPEIVEASRTSQTLAKHTDVFVFASQFECSGLQAYCHTRIAALLEDHSSEYVEMLDIFKHSTPKHSRSVANRRPCDEPCYIILLLI